MSDPSPRSAEAPSLWAALRDFLHLKSASSLRESIEEAIEEHGPGADPDDLDTAERAMLRNMLDLADRKAGDVAVPRSRIIAIAEKASFEAAVALFREAGHSRLPVYRGSLDEVVGMVHVKDVYAVLADRFAGEVAEPPALKELVRHVLFVPPSMPVTDLLTDMRRKRTHMAIIVDEYGGTDGLATIEDIVEEIVGDIEDEHDEEEGAQLVQRDDGSVEADAAIDLDDLETALGAGFEPPDLADEVDTLGGLAVLIAGRVPVAGDVIEHPNGWRIEVAASDGRRVERLRLIPPGATGDGTGDR
jgi:CBS domain containing-hemolysin-like protein